MPPRLLSADRVMASKFMPWATATVAPSPGLHAIGVGVGVGAGVVAPPHPLRSSDAQRPTAVPALAFSNSRRVSLRMSRRLPPPDSTHDPADHRVAWAVYFGKFSKSPN